MLDHGSDESNSVSHLKASKLKTYGIPAMTPHSLISIFDFLAVNDRYDGVADFYLLVIPSSSQSIQIEDAWDVGHKAAPSNSATASWR